MRGSRVDPHQPAGCFMKAVAVPSSLLDTPESQAGPQDVGSLRYISEVLFNTLLALR